MTAAANQLARRTGPRELSVEVTPLPRRRPLAFLTDLLNGAEDIARRQR